MNFVRVLCRCGRIRSGSRDHLNPNQTMDRCVHCKAYSFLSVLENLNEVNVK